METRCIATSCDSKYFPALIAFLKSTWSQNRATDIIVFDGGLTNEQKERVGKYSTVIKKDPFIKLENKGKFGYIGNTTLLKFEVIGLDFDKVLYLDVDTVVLENLDILFDIPKNLVGVVPEVNSPKNMFRLQDRKKLLQEIDINWSDPGFNAGVFCLRPGEWSTLKEDAAGLIEKFGPEVFSKTKDQQILNILFNSRTYSYPARYNFSPMYDIGKITDPAIVHYLTETKPWQKEYPLGHFYDRFRKNLSFREFPYILAVDLTQGLKKIDVFLNNLYNIK